MNHTCISGYYGLPSLPCPACNDLLSGRTAWPIDRQPQAPPCSPKRIAEIFLPFSNAQTILQPGKAELTIQPDLDFRPLRLAVAPSCAKYFRILALYVGNRICAPAGGLGASAQFFPPLPGDKAPAPIDERMRSFFLGGVSAEFFPALPRTIEEIARNKAFVQIGFPTCHPHERIRMMVENTGRKPHKIEAILWGVCEIP